jgi:CubicO group peptidase (beta-lactamase class C family)
VDKAVGWTGDGVRLKTSHLHNVYCAAKPLLALEAIRTFQRAGVPLATSLGELTSDYPQMQDVTLRDLLTHAHPFPGPNSLDWRLADSSERELSLAASDLRLGRPGCSGYSEIAGWAALWSAAKKIDANFVVPNQPDLIVDLESLHHFDSVKQRIACYLAGDGERLFPLLHDRAWSVCSEISPVLGGLASARGLGRWYEMILAEGSYRHALDESLLTRRGRCQDDVLGRSCDFSAGFMIGLQDHGFGPVPSAAFGHSGWLGASFAFCDPTLGLIGAAVVNLMAPPEVHAQGRAALVAAMYEDATGHIRSLAREP